MPWGSGRCTRSGTHRDHPFGPGAEVQPTDKALKRKSRDWTTEDAEYMEGASTAFPRRSGRAGKTRAPRPVRRFQCFSSTLLSVFSVYSVVQSFLLLHIVYAPERRI